MNLNLVLVDNIEIRASEREIELAMKSYLSRFSSNNSLIIIIYRLHSTLSDYEIANS